MIRGLLYTLIYVGYIWDSVSVHYRGMRVSSKRGTTVLGRHGSASLCRVERENKMAATYNVLAFKS